MARKRQSSPLEDLIEVMEFIFRYVPPWLSIPVALAVFFGISTSFKTPSLEKVGYMLGGLVGLAILVAGSVGTAIASAVRLSFARTSPWTG